MMVAAALALHALAAGSAPYMMAIAVNNPGIPGLAALNYADDDAAEAALLYGAQPQRTFLHTIMDPETQARYPGLVQQTRMPAWRDIDVSVKTLQAAIREDVAAGEKPVVFVWLSGHAARGADGQVSFPLAGGTMTPLDLRLRILGHLTDAHRVHVIVDTCFAGAMVRARAQVNAVSVDVGARAFGATDLASFANVGSLVAATPGTRAYEWEEIRAGVFSAMVRAGLRGAADVDGNREVRYGELDAFLSAAAQGVALDRARPRVTTQAPVMDQNAVLSRMDWLPDVARFEGDIAGLGPVHVLDGKGGWLLAGNFEAGFQPALWLPRGRTLYLRAGQTDWPLVLADNGVLQMGVGVQSDAQARSMEGEALRQGLFTVPYGPAFHRGFTAGAQRVSPSVQATEAPRGALPAWWMPAPLLVAGLGAGLAGLAAGAVAGGAALFFVQTDQQVPALRAFAVASVSGGLAVGLFLAFVALLASAVAIVVLSQVWQVLAGG